MNYLPAQAPLPDGTLLLANDADVLALAERLAGHPAVALQFPKWTDGRAYSQAVLLRSRLRYAGTLIATGEVLADMLPLLRRCGFDTVQLRADQRVETAQRALGLISSHYQRSAVERQSQPGAAQ